MTAPRRLIIDTDPALGVIHEGRPRDVDDAFAIAEVIRAPDLALAGITVTFGNAPLPAALGVARRLVDLAGVDVPVAAGQAEALPTEGPVQATAAVELLHELLAEAPARVAALGPLGNLGALLLRYPEDAARIEEVVIVGGRSAGRAFYIGDVGPVRDFNFENDVRAARVLLEAGIPVVCAGFELSSPLCMTGAHLDAIAAHDTAMARALATDARPWLDHWTHRFTGDIGFHPWDSAAVCWLRHPEYIHSERRGWRIRDVRLATAHSQPDDSPQQVAWLETDVAWGSELTFCTGFTEQGAEQFLQQVMRDCR